jgi:hypothetical protein
MRYFERDIWPDSHNADVDRDTGKYTDPPRIRPDGTWENRRSSLSWSLDSRPGFNEDIQSELEVLIVKLSSSDH